VVGQADFFFSKTSISVKLSPAFADIFGGCHRLAVEFICESDERSRTASDVSALVVILL